MLSHLGPRLTCRVHRRRRIRVIGIHLVQPVFATGNRCHGRKDVGVGRTENHSGSRTGGRTDHMYPGRIGVVSSDHLAGYPGKESRFSAAALLVPGSAEFQQFKALRNVRCVG